MGQCMSKWMPRERGNGQFCFVANDEYIVNCYAYKAARGQGWLQFVCWVARGSRINVEGHISA